MKKIAKSSLATAIAITGFTSSVYAADSISEAFSNGKVKGSVKSYYFAQDFDGAGKNDSSIWANGGSLNFVTDSYKGLVLGSTFQTSHVTSIDDKDSKTKSSMDAQGSVLSEAYLQYTYNNTTFKGGRQFVSTPLLAGSGSRLIKEAFEAYLLANSDIPDTTIVAGLITKYQQRTDYTTTASFTTANTDANGGPGEFMKIGTDGIRTVYIKNTSIPNLTAQFQYADAVDIASLIYVDAKYKFGPAYVAAQYYDTNYDANTSKDNSMYGLKIGADIANVNVFAGYTSTDGKAGEDAVVRGLGQGAYAHYTATTKTAGGDAFTAGTDAWQIGAGYKFGELKTKLRYTSFDLPTAGTNSDLDETTLNLEYKFTKALTAQIDYSILDYEDDERDATDLRSRLIYSF
ncbi:porin [Poseidonibacter lekithochrous]|uniref:OprD family outer membrane porin n=1 Tax=Poseidonibacter TaxID=2321187 RepID=UPI001C0838B8|nr:MULTISPECIES: OprD family outer membrane porin [Poseidonibacter]MBU3015628.1 porin [Poseidonibacter lekithochrous]MDO6828928.1 OprD family outer membrane porin [Poseidonibacter sp. 1_MG-2023]